MVFYVSAVVFILVNQWLQNGSSEMFEHSQLFGGTWAWAHQALCFSCGYFAYDQWDMLHYGLYSGLIPSILAHHLLLLICFTLALYRNVTINYLILTLICEVHYVFLNPYLSLGELFSYSLFGNTVLQCFEIWICQSDRLGLWKHYSFESAIIVTSCVPYTF